MLSGNRNSNHRNFLFVFFSPSHDLTFQVLLSHTLIWYIRFQVLYFLASAHSAHQVDALHLWDRAQLWAVVISQAGSLYTDAFESHLRRRSESQKVQHHQLAFCGVLLENKNKCFFWNWQLPPKFCFGSYFFSLLNPVGGSWDDSPYHLSEDGDQSVLNPMLSVHFSLGSDRNRNTVVYL